MININRNAIGKGNFINYTDFDDVIEAMERFAELRTIEFVKWIDKEEIPYEDGRWIKYFNEKDNYLTFEELYKMYLSQTGEQAN